MPAEATANPPATDREHHITFFRQSGWLMVANILGGLFTWAVHLLAKVVPESEYATFGTLLMVTACMPILPLQMVYSHQTASTLATDRRRQLAGMIRGGWLWTIIVWTAAPIIVLIFQGSICERWQLSNSMALWVTLAAVLMNLWMPLFSGVLQGRQDFLWLGWAMITGGVARLAGATALVFAFHGGATAMMAGTFIGIGVWAGVGIWRSRDLWSARPEPYDRQAFRRQVLPLVFGFGASQVLFTSDTIFAMTWFSGHEMAPYVAAGTLSRGLLWLVLPLAMVMFPKIVHTHAKSEKSTLMRIVLPSTALLSIGGGLCMCLLGPFVVKIVYKESYVAATTALLPWYAGAMVPLALANVLVNDFLARGRFRIVLPMVLITLAYCFTLPYVLNRVHRLEAVLQTLAAYNVLLFVVCLLFSRWDRKVGASPARA